MVCVHKSHHSKLSWGQSIAEINILVMVMGEVNLPVDSVCSARAMRAGFPNFAHSAGCLERCRSQPALPLWNKEQRRVWDGTTFGAACRYDSPVPPATMAGGAAPP